MYLEIKQTWSLSELAVTEDHWSQTSMVWLPWLPGCKHAHTRSHSQARAHMHACTHSRTHTRTLMRMHPLGRARERERTKGRWAMNTEWFIEWKALISEQSALLPGARWEEIGGCRLKQAGWKRESFLLLSPRLTVFLGIYQPIAPMKL